MFDNLEHIASRVQMKLLGGVVTDENRFPLNLVEDAVHAARAWYLGEKLSKKFTIPGAYYQRVNCLKIRCEETMCDGIGTGEFRYLVTIPEVVGGLGRAAIRFAGDVNGKISFLPTSTLNPEEGDHFPFVPQKTVPKYFFFGNELELFNLPTPNMKYFMLDAIFANPAHPLIKMCDDTARPYPIPADDIKIIEDLITKDYYYTLLRIRPDLKNDATPNT